MSRKIIIKLKNLQVKAELNSSHTATLIYNSLPLKSQINRWGEEIYFPIPINYGLEEGYIRSSVKEGDLGYWPEGNCFCIFYGPTPISNQGQIRPASEINLIGKLLDAPSVFKKIPLQGEIIILKEGEERLWPCL